MQSMFYKLYSCENASKVFEFTDECKNYHLQNFFSLLCCVESHLNSFVRHFQRNRASTVILTFRNGKQIINYQPKFCKKLHWTFMKLQVSMPLTNCCGCFASWQCGPSNLSIHSKEYHGVIPVELKLSTRSYRQLLFLVKVPGGILGRKIFDYQLYRNSVQCTCSRLLPFLLPGKKT